MTDEQNPTAESAAEEDEVVPEAPTEESTEEASEEVSESTEDESTEEATPKEDVVEDEKTPEEESPKAEKPGWVDEAVWTSLSEKRRKRLCAGESIEAVCQNN